MTYPSKKLNRNYDTGATWNGTLADDTVVLRVPFARKVTFVAGLLNSQGYLGVAATAQTDFDIQKNQVSVGTMRFAASGTVATFIMATNTTFSPGDVLEVISPNPADSTAADLGFVLVGIR